MPLTEDKFPDGRRVFVTKMGGDHDHILKHARKVVSQLDDPSVEEIRSQFRRSSLPSFYAPEAIVEQLQAGVKVEDLSLVFANDRKSHGAIEARRCYEFEAHDFELRPLNAPILVGTLEEKIPDGWFVLSAELQGGKAIRFELLPICASPLGRGFVFVVAGGKIYELEIDKADRMASKLGSLSGQKRMTLAKKLSDYVESHADEIGTVALSL